LETGEILTDPFLLKVRHVGVFGDESPTAPVWDFLLRDKPGRQEQSLYRCAVSCLAAEPDAVEGMFAASCSPDDSPA